MSINTLNLESNVLYGWVYAGRSLLTPVSERVHIFCVWVFAGFWRSLYVGLKTIHVYGTVILLLGLPLVMVRGLLPVNGPDAFLQLPDPCHIRGEVLGLPQQACRWGLEAAILLVCHHLLDADHGLGLTNEGDLWGTDSQEKGHMVTGTDSLCCIFWLNDVI